MLLNWLFSDTETNWVRSSHTQEISRKGLRVIMPDVLNAVQIAELLGRKHRQKAA